MIPTGMLGEIDKSSQGTLIDLFELDLTEFGGQIYYFCNLKNEKAQDIVWRGVTYVAYPIQLEGAELSNEGASNRPKLHVANVEGLITGLVEEFDLIIGAKLIRRQVLDKFLDEVNFHSGNPNADPTQEYVTTYIVSQLASLSSSQASFGLSLPIETDDAQIPARLIIANVCNWEYRGDGCGYSGLPVANEFDEPVFTMAEDKCSCSLKGCRLRWGKDAVLPFGGFPSVDRLN